MSKRRCIGFGEYEGKCEAVAVHPPGPKSYWCERCEQLRREHIGKQLEKMVKRNQGRG